MGLRILKSLAMLAHLAVVRSSQWIGYFTDGDRITVNSQDAFNSNQIAFSDVSVVSGDAVVVPTNDIYQLSNKQAFDRVDFFGHADDSSLSWYFAASTDDGPVLLSLLNMPTSGVLSRLQVGGFPQGQRAVCNPPMADKSSSYVSFLCEDSEDVSKAVLYYGNLNSYSPYNPAVQQLSRQQVCIERLETTQAANYRRMDGKFFEDFLVLFDSSAGTKLCEYRFGAASASELTVTLIPSGTLSSIISVLGGDKKVLLIFTETGDTRRVAASCSNTDPTKMTFTCTKFDIDLKETDKSYLLTQLGKRLGYLDMAQKSLVTCDVDLSVPSVTNCLSAKLESKSSDCTPSKLLDLTDFGFQVTYTTKVGRVCQVDGFEVKSPASLFLKERYLMSFDGLFYVPGKLVVFQGSNAAVYNGSKIAGVSTVFTPQSARGNFSVKVSNQTSQVVLEGQVIDDFSSSLVTQLPKVNLDFHPGEPVAFKVTEDMVLGNNVQIKAPAEGVSIFRYRKYDVEGIDLQKYACSGFFENGFAMVDYQDNLQVFSCIENKTRGVLSCVGESRFMLPKTDKGHDRLIVQKLGAGFCFAAISENTTDLCCLATNKTWSHRRVTEFATQDVKFSLNMRHVTITMTQKSPAKLLILFSQSIGLNLTDLSIVDSTDKFPAYPPTTTYTPTQTCLSKMWVPRENRTRAFMLSDCESEGSRLMLTDISPGNLSMSKTIFLPGKFASSSAVLFCVLNGHLYLSSVNDNEVWVFDLQSNLTSRFAIPLTAYQVGKIFRLECLSDSVVIVARKAGAEDSSLVLALDGINIRDARRRVLALFDVGVKVENLIGFCDSQDPMVFFRMSESSMSVYKIYLEEFQVEIFSNTSKPDFLEFSAGTATKKLPLMWNPEADKPSPTITVVSQSNNPPEIGKQYPLSKLVQIDGHVLKYQVFNKSQVRQSNDGQVALKERVQFSKYNSLPLSPSPDCRRLMRIVSSKGMLGFAVQLDTATTYYIESNTGVREAVPLASLCFDLSVDDVTDPQAAAGSFEYVVGFLCGEDALTTVRLLQISIKDGVSHTETIHADDSRIGHVDKLRVRKSLQSDLYLLAAYEKVSRTVKVYGWSPDEDSDFGLMSLFATVSQGSLCSLSSGRPVLLRASRGVLPPDHRRPEDQPAAVQRLLAQDRRTRDSRADPHVPPAAGLPHRGLLLSPDCRGGPLLHLHPLFRQHREVALRHLADRPSIHSSRRVPAVRRLQSDEPAHERAVPAAEGSLAEPRQAARAAVPAAEHTAELDRQLRLVLARSGHDCDRLIPH